MIFHIDHVNETAFIDFTNAAGMHITLSSKGASIYELTLDGEDMITTANYRKEFAGDAIKYYGQTIGPIAVRIPNGDYKVGGISYHLSPNEKGNVLHSSSINWGFAEFSPSINLGESKTEVVFCLDFAPSPIEAPKMKVKVTYLIYEFENKFEILYEVIPEEDCLLNPTNHLYWNLGERNASFLSLRIDSPCHMVYQEDLIPIGTQPNQGVFDFSSLALLGHLVDGNDLNASSTNGFDHYFFINDGHILLESHHYRLKLYTSRNGVLIYTSNYPSPVLLKGRKQDYPRSGVTLETMDDPRLEKIKITKAGETYRAKNIYVLEKKG